MDVIRIQCAKLRSAYRSATEQDSAFIAHSWRQPLLAFLACACSNGASALSPPDVSPWEYHLCDEAAPFISRMKVACEEWYDGTWVVYPSGPQCENANSTVPGDELVIRAEAFETRVHKACTISSTWTGWLAPGESSNSYMCWGGPPQYVHGIESWNTALIPTNGLSKDSNGNCVVPWSEDVYALRTRRVECPDGHTWSGDWCTPYGASPFKNNACKSSQGVPNLAGNPFHVPLGFKYETAADIPKTTVFSIPFSRFYSSADHWDPSFFGPHWRHTYAYRIVRLQEATYDTATLIRPSGDRYDFFRSANGTWTTTPEITGTLTETPLGYKFKASNNQIE